MSLLQINRNPSARELRQFAGIWFPLFLAIVGGVLWVKFDLPLAAPILWTLAAVLAVVGILRPPVIRPLFVGWMIAAYPIGWLFSHALMAVVFFGIMTPIGFVMRLFGYDPMRQRVDPAANTYWKQHTTGSEAAEYFRQY